MELRYYSQQILKPIIKEFSDPSGRIIFPYGHQDAIDDVVDAIYEILYQAYLDKTFNYSIGWFNDGIISNYVGYNATKGLCVFSNGDDDPIIALFQLRANGYFVFGNGTLDFEIKDDSFMPLLLIKIKHGDPDFYAWMLLSGLDETIFEAKR